jgi:hypothetical protein
MGQQLQMGRSHFPLTNQSSINGLDLGNFDMRHASSFDPLPSSTLPKIETGLGLGIGGGLRTAPVSMMGEGFDLDRIFASRTTVNPAQLHIATTPDSPFSPSFPLTGRTDEDDAFAWPHTPADTLMGGMSVPTRDESSPSVISTGSQSGLSEVMIDGSNNPMRNSGSVWPTPITVSTSQFTNDPIASAVFPELIQSSPAMVSPRDLHHDPILGGGASLDAIAMQTGLSSFQSQYFHPIVFDPDTNSMGSPAAKATTQRVSPLPASIESITDAMRQALLFSLAQDSAGLTGRNASSTVLSPVTPGYTTRSSLPSVSLPSTADLQRYVNAYINFFHPHMPFLHIPTLNFESPAFTSDSRRVEDVACGAGCLILAMAAIGASYEYEHEAAQELSEAAKRMISIYLEERRQQSASSSGREPEKRPPLWLVQAMLLNLIYGHQCGDAKAAQIATTHCAALIGLAKSAELGKPDPEVAEEERKAFARWTGNTEVDLSDALFNKSASQEEFSHWYHWRLKEERKRTLFSVFILSSLLVTAYNHQPKILNSELHLDLPCEEDIWAAENPTVWRQLGGANGDNSRLTFADALTYLLNSNARLRSRGRSGQQSFTLGEGLKLSTFGCYILINALHVYIWDTRQRHQGRQWKAQETEQLYSQVEPALQEWQAAWSSNPNHHLDHPSPCGPLPGDSIPLLDLAYIRLFVNLGRSKDAFWARDFEAVANELGGAQTNGEGHDGAGQPRLTEDMGHMRLSESFLVEVNEVVGGEAPNAAADRPSKREWQLRKAAFYAADSLCMADRLGVAYGSASSAVSRFGPSRDLPIQAAVCTFDCAQVLAEWLGTVQDRVGRHTGMLLGRDKLDVRCLVAAAGPAGAGGGLLEDEDAKLLDKVDEILRNADVKISLDAAALGGSAQAVLAPMNMGGYAYKLLQATAYTLDKAAIWGSKLIVQVEVDVVNAWTVTKIMARSMRIHAEVLKRRAEASTRPTTMHSLAMM